MELSSISSTIDSRRCRVGSRAASLASGAGGLAGIVFVPFGYSAVAQYINLSRWYCANLQRPIPFFTFSGFSAMCPNLFW